MDYLSACAIAKDETPYLEEWVEYHRLAGIEKFYIYDNGSRIPIRQTLRRQVEEGVVHVTDYPGEGKHVYAFAECLVNHGSKTRWMAFFDIDEFIVPVTGDIPSLLREFEPYPSILVNWFLFGPSGQKSRPPGLQIDHFTMRAPVTHSTYGKTIVRPECAAGALHTHCIMLKPGFKPVNERKEAIPYGPSNTPPSGDRIRINHYYTRSSGEFEEKINRGRSDQTRLLHTGDFLAVANAATIEDQAIRRFASPLRRRLYPGMEAVLEIMKPVDGWFTEEEAEQFYITATHSLDLEGSIVEVGSYKGRSTVVLGKVAEGRKTVYAIDPHGGEINTGVVWAPTLVEFNRNMEAAGLSSTVSLIQKKSFEVTWDQPISMIFIDGIHTYENVSRDYHHFIRHVVPGGIVAFHDYVDGYPDIKKFVNELVAKGELLPLSLTGGLKVLRRPHA